MSTRSASAFLCFAFRFDAGWKFDDMGIGGLGGQFQEMFRRAFVSRIFPPEVVEKLGIVHCKGIMLYGPPGTGQFPFID